MVTILLILCSPVHNISQNDKDAANYGLETGKGIAELLAQRDFGKSLTKIGKSVGPYLGALGPFVGIITAVIPSESDELAFMKNMMKEIDKRLDNIDNRFNDIEKMIKWSVVQINFGQIEQRIQATSREFKYLYEVPMSAVQNRKLLFISNYKSDYQNSGNKLFQAIIQGQGTFQEDLGTSVLRYTGKDRRKTQLFLLGVMQLLLQAVKVELGYLLVNQYTHNANFMKLEWEKKIQTVRKKFEYIDYQCANVYYHAQSGKELDEYSAKNKGLTNSQFASGLFQHLGGKYYWRDWAVIAYNPIWGGDNHWVGVSGGHIKFRKDGRNIVVASVDKKHSVMDLARAEQDMKKVSMTYRTGNWWTGYRDARRNAKDVFNSLDKRGASLVSVIRCYNNMTYHYHSKRYRYVPRCPHFDLFMWG
ncbi:cephalotoxin-like protein [Mytilus californianus]|uniref:cephalotoxin-like protein n=1 Tax=Mytilus californianus TaxID=6549 RepID=UPI0022480E25|nr:cephalotoxin-like protein [Mytilus californianus]